MTVVKTFLVLLFSLALLGSRTVVSATPLQAGATTEAKGCACCDCGQRACCMQESPSVPMSPLASSALISTSQAQPIALTVCRLLLQLPTIEADRFAEVHLSVPSAPAVPLFKQNCVFLI